MAENKRQSIGNRVATPKLGIHGPGDLDAALAKAIGARVKITTATPNITLEGTIFTADPITNLVAINTSPASLNASSEGSNKESANYHIIPISRIQTFHIISLPDAAARTASAAFPALGPIDLRAVKAREDAAIRHMKEKDAMRGKGVGKEGQDVFDALARTLPTRWHETTIVVSDAVLISKPYRLEDCTAPKDQQNALTRVKRVLDVERQKIAARNDKEGATPTGTARKGG